MKRTYCLARLREFVADSSGQSLLEGALVLPVLLVTCLGVVELGLAIQHQHIVTSLSREGSNLISRETTLEDAATTLSSMSGGTVDLGSNTRVIFTVLKRGGTVGTANEGRLVLYERYEYGSYSATSRLLTRGSPTLGHGPHRGELRYRHRVAVAERAGESCGHHRRSDLRHRDLQPPAAHRAARKVRRERAGRDVFDRLLLISTEHRAPP